MHTSLLQILLWLTAGVALIVVCTAKWRLHAFFALIIASFVVGVGVEIPITTLLNIIRTGFGNIMASLGLIIVLGTTLGALLEHTDCTRVMADFILKRTGRDRAPLAMSITGFIVGLPIFCDSGYVVLSGLNKSLARRTGIPAAVMSVSLATGLYSVHCLVPPHPGPTAAAGIIGVEYGKLILAGIVVAIPATIAGHLWARFMGKRFTATTMMGDDEERTEERKPKVLQAFLPVVIPLLLIALRSFVSIENTGRASWTNAILALGEPVLALSVGIVLAITCMRSWDKHIFGTVLEDAVYKAGGILVIIGAGGAFGAVLAATKLGDHIGALPLSGLGIFVPFFITSLLKTAQGSSTVAIITTASIAQPLLPALGLDSSTGHLLCVLSMGAGSMMISHANDAYFWVIAKFSGLEIKAILLVYSIASVFMGLTSLLMVYIIEKIIS